MSVALLAAVGACGDSSAPAVPASIVQVGSFSQWGIAGQPVGEPIEIQIRDANGRSLKGVPFTVTVVGGGNILQPPNSTLGETTVIGVWTLGGSVGTQSIVIQSGDLSLTITVSALPSAPALATANGVPQTATGTVGMVSSIVPTIKVLDGFGNPIVGTLITPVVTGGGSLDSAQATTNDAGVATLGAWAYGTVAGTQSVALIASHVSPVNFIATVNAGAAVGAVASGAVMANGSIGIPAPFQPSIKVVDVFGNGVSNVSVAASPSAGSSVQFASSLTNAFGIATVGAWTLSTTPGVDTLTMTAAGFAPITFTVPVTRVPASIVMAAGKFQTASPSTALATNPVFQVLDFIGNPMAGVAVQFSTTFGGGALSVASAVTDAQGLASPGAWTLGATPGSQTMQASAQAPTGLVARTLFATALAPGGSAYNLQVRFADHAPTPAVQAAFDAGAARVAQEITGHQLARTLSNFPINVCFPGAPPGLSALNETISDNLLLVIVAPIDGAGGAVASARICVNRSPSIGETSVPIVSAIVLDDADVDALVAAGTLNTIVLHEIHHALGIGTLWDLGTFFFPVRLVPGNGGPGPVYLGAAASQAYVAAGGTSADGIPVEDIGVVGGGVRDNHWKESVLHTELMTSAVDAAVPNPLSAISIMALADLGYAVSTASADTYSLPLGASPAAVRSAMQTPVRELLLPPLFVVSGTGVLTRIGPIPPRLRGVVGPGTATPKRREREDSQR